MDNIRIILEDEAQSSADGLAGDECLACMVGAGKSPATLRLYRYRPSVIVGRYQNLTDAISLEQCRRYGVQWNRRHTGGGTVLMGPEQLAVGLALPEKGSFTNRSIRYHFELFARLFNRALSRCGIDSSFVGKNDLQVGGKKIAGLAISQDIQGSIFYHASLLLDFDIKMMVDILRLPTEHLEDKGQSCFSQRMTTVREHGEAEFEQMVRYLLQGVEEVIGMVPTSLEWSPEEREGISKLKADRYENDAWIYSQRVMRRWKGVAERKTGGGNLRVYIDKTGSVLDAVLITGDYFTRGIELAQLESRLRGIRFEKQPILATLEEIGSETLYRIPNHELTELILSAKEQRALSR